MACDAKFAFVYNVIDTFVQTFDTANCCLWVDRHRHTHPHIMYTLPLSQRYNKTASHIFPFGYRSRTYPVVVHRPESAHCRLCRGERTHPYYHIPYGHGSPKQQFGPFRFKWFPKHRVLKSAQLAVDYTLPNVLGKHDAIQNQDPNKHRKLAEEPKKELRARLANDQKEKDRKKGILVCVKKRKPYCMEPIVKVQARL